MFSEFSDLFGPVRTCSDLLGPVRTCSDAFGCIQMHLEAFGCVRTRSENFGNFGPENTIFALLEGILTAWDNLGPLPDLRERHLDVYVWGGSVGHLPTNIK